MGLRRARTIVRSERAQIGQVNITMHTDPRAFAQVSSVLREMGSAKTLARKPKYFTFFQDLPIYVEANRPRRFHQTVEFDIRGKDLRSAQATLRFRQIAEKNPHADGDFEQDPIVKPGLLKYYLNDREIPQRELNIQRAEPGRIPSGFTIGPHQTVEYRFSGNKLRNGTNTLAFEMSKFPQEEDPYVYIYDLEVELIFH